jgi:uncharacterized protein (DUF1015 family)
MEDAIIQRDMNHHLQKGLIAQFRVDPVVILSHETGCEEIVSDQAVTSAVSSGGGVHEEVNLLDGLDP